MKLRALVFSVLALAGTLASVQPFGSSLSSEMKGLRGIVWVKSL